MSKYSSELKAQVIKEARDTGNVALVAKRHQVPPATAHGWLRGKDIPTHIANNKVRELEQALEEQRLENKILKDLLKKQTKPGSETRDSLWLCCSVSQAPALDFERLPGFQEHLVSVFKACGGLWSHFQRSADSWLYPYRDGTIIPDVVIEKLCMDYRKHPFFESHGSSKKLSKYLQKEHGFYTNHKKIYTILKENKLLLPKRLEKKVPWRRIAFNHSIGAPNQLWEFDIKYGYTAGEQRFFFVLALIDVFSRKCVGSYLGKSCKHGDLTFSLKKAIADSKANPQTLTIRSDNGPQMTSRQFHEALIKIEKDLQHEFIPPRTPNKNAHVESFFSILELELLRNRYYPSFSDAYDEVHRWIEFYNERRLHGSLGDRSPNEFLQLLHQGHQIPIEAVSV